MPNRHDAGCCLECGNYRPFAALKHLCSEGEARPFISCLDCGLPGHPHNCPEDCDYWQRKEEEDADKG